MKRVLRFFSLVYIAASKGKLVAVVPRQGKASAAGAAAAEKKADS